MRTDTDDRVELFLALYTCINCREGRRGRGTEHVGGGPSMMDMEWARARLLKRLLAFPNVDCFFK